MAKRITINLVEKILKENIPNDDATFDWHGVEVTVRKRLSLREMMLFVENVAKSCFSESGEYRPEMRDVAYKIALISFYTNLTLPADPEKAYSIVSRIDFYDELYGSVDLNQIEEIDEAIEEKVRLNANESIQAVTVQMNQFLANLSNLSNEFGTVLSTLTSDDVTAMANAMKSGQIDANDVVAAYLEQVKKAE